jgi:MFS family permease
VIAAVWVPGVGLALSAVGFGAITTFIVLLFAQHGWGQGWLALTLLSVAFSGGRIAFGHLPDRIGGARVALVCVLIEAAGQALIWLAPWPALALVGAALSGFGYALVFPGLGVEAVRRVPAQSRGLATGTFTAFLDLALGVSSPALGLVAGRAGLSAVFLASTLVVLCAAAIALWLLFAARAPRAQHVPLRSDRRTLLTGGRHETSCGDGRVAFSACGIIGAGGAGKAGSAADAHA